MSKGVQIAGGATLIALLLGWFAASNLEGATFAYYESLSEFQARAAGAREHARVHGYVAPGSIQRDLAGHQVRFAVQNDPPHAGGAPGEQLTVVLAGLETPDLFKDGAEVVIEGRPRGVSFHADKVFAKCPSKFRAEAPASAPL